MPNLKSSDFQRAFAAVSYFCGRRGAQLLEPLPSPHTDARALVQKFGHSERDRRAEILAHELTRLASALELRTVK